MDLGCQLEFHAHVFGLPRVHFRMDIQSPNNWGSHTGYRLIRLQDSSTNEGFLSVFSHTREKL